MSEPDLELKSRKIETRNPCVITCVIFTIEEIQENFELAMRTIDTNLLEGEKLEKEGKVKLAEDLYRFLIASLESAFDYFIHCILKLGFQEMYLQERECSDRYNKFCIPMSVVSELLNNSNNANALLLFIDERFSADTYLGYDKFKEAFSFIDKDLINGVCADIYNGNQSKLKDFIEKIYKRRNLIVHQDDRVSLTGEKSRISSKQVIDFKNELQKIVFKIISKF